MCRIIRFLMMILTLLCVVAQGSEPFTPAESLSYKRSDSGIVITGLKDKSLTQLNLPAEIDGLPVTVIGEHAFAGCADLTRVTIPEGVTVIGKWTFVGCTGLTRVTIPESVTVIGRFAFSSCTNLTRVTIPGRFTLIGEYAFIACTRLTIHAPAGSKAQRYAGENGIPFVAE